MNFFSSKIGKIAGNIALWADTPRADTPLGRHLLAQCMLGYSQQAGGTHPTGMHSCCSTAQFHNGSSINFHNIKEIMKMYRNQLLSANIHF